MSHDENAFDKLSSLLEDQYTWPDYYLFKFIVPADALDLLKNILIPLDSEVNVKLSKKGNYVSVSVRPLIKKTDDVIEVYQNVKQVKGIVVL